MALGPDSPQQSAMMIAFSQADLIPGFLIPADVFVKLGSGDFVQVLRKGAKGSLTDLHAAEAGKTGEFYIRKEEFSECVTQNVKVLTVMMRKAEVPFPRKVQFLSTALNSVFREICEVELTPSSLANLRTASQLIQETIEGSHMVAQVVDQMRSLGSDLVKSSVLTSVFVTAMGRQLQLGKESIEELALAGLLCDVGYSKLPDEVVNKPIHLLSPVELAQWQNHVQQSSLMLRSLRSVSDSLIRMIEEQHERPNGYGFPKGLRDSQILAGSKLLQVAHGVATAISKSARNPEPLSLLDCVKVTDQHELSYSSSAWLAFKKSLDLI